MPYNEVVVDKKEVQPGGIERESVVKQMPVVETEKKQEESPEVESFLEKIERRFARIPKGMPGPQGDNVVVQQASSQQPPVSLPVTKAGMKKGKKSPVENSIAWLVTWAMRRMKQLSKLGKRVVLQDLPEFKKESK